MLPLFLPVYIYRIESIVDLFYFRYGDSIGTLNVYLFDGVYKPIWSLSGNRGNQWYEGQVSYVSSVPHQILVEGIAGKDFLVRANF